MTERTRRPRSSRIRRLVVIELETPSAVTEHWTQHLSHGGAFGPPGGRNHALVTLMIVGPAQTPFELPAKTVYCGSEGTGYEITGFNAALKKALADWVKANTREDAAERAPTTRMLKLTREKKR